jgi:hypothetical protein
MSKSLFAKVSLAAAVAVLPAVAVAQLVVTPINGTTVTPDLMAASLLSASSGITITNVTYSGANSASGMFTGGGGIIGIPGGVLLTAGSVNNVVGPNDDSGASTANGLPGDPDLDGLAGGDTNDASVLTITFVPTGSQIQFSYVFGSEEYNEYIGDFNDPFGFFVNGANRALIPGTSTPVTVNNINCGASGTGVGPNCSLFVNNEGAAFNTQLDGFTRVLSFTATVNPGVPNTLKIAIADALDEDLDSAVFIGAGSLQVCGGPGQPPCNGGQPPGPPQPPAQIPTLSEWALIALSGLAALIGMGRLRRRS